MLTSDVNIFRRQHISRSHTPVKIQPCLRSHFWDFNFDERNSFKYLTQMGAKVVGLADLSAAIFEKDGFLPELIEKLMKDKKSLADYPN